MRTSNLGSNNRFNPQHSIILSIYKIFPVLRQLLGLDCFHLYSLVLPPYLVSDSSASSLFSLSFLTSFWGFLFYFFLPATSSIFD